MSMPRQIAGFEEPRAFTSGNIDRWLYTAGNGPGVVLLHELPGLTLQCRKLADRLIAEGYRVYMPLLVGAPETKDLVGNTLKVCISREIHVFSRRGMGPISEWVRALCRKAHEECGGNGIGLIGMCLTGNFAISMMATPEVIAPVTCQPSLPIGRPKALAVDEQTLSAAKKNAMSLGNGALMGFRYKKDRICPAAKFERLRAEFGALFDGEEIPGAKHATLTEHLDDGALTKTLAFLRSRLHPSKDLSS